MKNQKGRNIISGLLLLCICSSLLGCNETSSTGSTFSSVIQGTSIFESVSSTYESESSDNQSIISSASTLTSSLISSVAKVSQPSVLSSISPSSRLSSISPSSRLSSNTTQTSSTPASSIGTESEATKPGPAPLTTPKKRMATNGMGTFTCLDDSGKLYVWGNSNLVNFPVDFPPFVDVALGQDFGVGLDANGKLYTWGDLGQNDHGQTRFGDNLPPFVEVEASAYHTAALTADGTLYKWGSGNNGDQKYVPQNLGKVKSVAVDAYVTGVVTSADKVVRWGVGPRNVFSFNYSMVSCSHYDVFALGKDGKVYGNFTLLDGNMEAIQPPTASNIVKISGTIALDSNGKVFVWGANQPYTHDEITDVPINLPKIIDITGSGSSGMALGENGKIYTWGMGAERSAGPAYDFLNTEPNVYAEEPIPDNKESISVKSYTELQSASANPMCTSITIEGNIVISVNSFRIEKDLTVAAGSTLVIESTAGNVMMNGKLTVNGSIVVRGRLVVVRDTDVTVTGSIIKQGSGKVTTYLNDLAHLENLLKSVVFNNIIYTPGSPTVLTIDRDVTIPSGKSVWLNINVTVKVASGSTLTVSGRIETYNSPIIEGKVIGNITVMPKG